MKNKEVMELYEGLNKVLSHQDLRFPAKVSFSMMRNYRNLMPIVDDIILAKDGVLQTYGSPIDDKPGYYHIPPENGEKAQAELNALDNIEQTVNILKITISDLEGMELSLEEMNCLYGMLEG